MTSRQGITSFDNIARFVIGIFTFPTMFSSTHAPLFRYPVNSFCFDAMATTSARVIFGFACNSREIIFSIDNLWVTSRASEVSRNGVSKLARHSEYDFVLSLPSLISIPDLSTATLRLTVPSSYSPTNSIQFLNCHFFRFTFLWDGINPPLSSSYASRAVRSGNAHTSEMCFN